VGLFTKKNMADASRVLNDGPRVSSGRPVLWYGSLAVLLVALLLLLAGVAFYWFDMQRQARSAGELSRLNAEDLVATISDSISRSRASLLRFSHQDALKNALSRDDQEQLRTLEKRFLDSFHDDGSVSFYSSEDIERTTLEGNRDAFALSFAAASMLRNAVRTRRPQRAEVHELNKSSVHIGLAVPVLQGNEVVGAIYLTLPMSVFNAPLERMRRYGSQLAIQQKAGGQVNVASTSPEMSSRAALGSVAIPGTIWQVAWWPATMAGVGVPLDLIAALFGAVAILTGVILILLSRKVSALITQDLSSVVSMVETMSSGRHARKRDVHLKEFDGTLGLIDNLSEASALSRLAGNGEGGLSAALGMSDNSGLAPDTTFGDSRMMVEEASGFPESGAPSRGLAKVPESLVRLYDIRGIAGDDLNTDVVRGLGQAIGSEAYEKGQQAVLVARDGRKSSPELIQALVDGLLASGIDVIDLGLAPSPLLYFGTHYLDSNSGVMLTGSHNPPEYNGLKIIIDGESLNGEALQRLRNRVNKRDLLEGQGSYAEQNLVADYLQQLGEDVQLAKPLKVVVDCGHGVASEVAPALLQRLGCEVIELNCTTDGDFPSHHPDPAQPANMRQLIESVRSSEADVGIAFDGDGDRLGIVDSSGKIIWPDRLLMFLASDVVATNPGTDVIFDVKSTRHLTSRILELGGRPIMWKSGHSLLKAKMRETGAMLAGELSGHIFFQDRWYGFDDALYAAARVLELLALDPRGSAEVFADLPESPSTPELLLILDGADPHILMERLLEKAQFPGAKVTDMDGLRAEFEEGWGLVRASNTMPALTFRFEARDQESLEKIEDVFRHFLQEMLPGLTLPF